MPDNKTDTQPSYEGANLGALAQAGEGAKAAIEELSSSLKDAGIDLQNLNNLTKSQVDTMGLAMTAIRQSRQLYTELGGAAGVAFNGFHEQNKQVLESLNLTEEGFGKVILAVSQNADNAMRLQKGYISLAASTGELNQVFATAGDNLENLSTLVEAQGNSMLASAAATSSSMTQVQGWYKSLGSIPGALKEVVKSNQEGTETTSLLTGAIKVAHGTGRDFNDVMKDLTEAYDKYGLKGEAALRFSVRMTDVTNSLGARMSTVTAALNSVATAFGGMVDQGDSAARMMDGNTNIMNRYASALKETGISGDRAAGIAASMVTEISKLNTAQKALLSGQTGGPGGLLGSVQIDKLLREGKTEEVAGLVQKAMRRQLGPIITQQEVKTQADAERFTAQKLILQEGPLGKLAKDDDSATRLLEAMKAGKMEAFTLPEKDNTVQQAMERGTKIEEQTTTEFTKLYNFFEQSDFKVAMSNLAAMQAGFGARDIFGQTPTSQSAERMQKLRGDGKDMTRTSGEIAAGIDTTLQNPDAAIGKALEQINIKFSERSIKSAISSGEGLVKDTSNLLGQIAPMMPASLRTSVTGKMQESLGKLKEDQNEAVKKAAELEKSNIDKEKIKKIQDEIKQRQETINTIDRNKALVKSADATLYNTVLPENQLQQATEGTVNQSTEAKAEGAAQAQRQQGAQRVQQTQHLEITAICLGCQTKLKTGQLEGTAPGARGGP